MRSIKNCLIISKKELREIFRDRSTFIILLIPIVIFPIFNIGIGYLNKDSPNEINICIEYDNQEAYDIIMQFVLINEKFQINLVDSNKPKELLKNGNIDCYVKINKSNFDFIYSSSSYNSLSLTTKFGDSFQRFYNVLLCQSYDGIFQMNLKDENNNFANTSKSISNIFIPIILVMLVFKSTSSFANDIFAGEKERKTLELLFLSGVKKHHVYFGKSLALLMVSAINLILSLISYFISFGFAGDGLSQFKFMQNGNVGTNILSIVFILTLLSIIAVFFSLTVSIISTNMKNSQILNEIVLIIPVVITALLAFGIIKSDIIILKYIPVVNLLVDFYNIFASNVDIVSIILSFIINVVVISMLIVFSGKYMNTERIFS